MFIKLSALTFTALASVTSAEFHLRSATNKFLGNGNSGNTDLTDARAVVHGIKHAASAEELSIIGQAIVSAYNHAYEGAGYNMESFKAQSMSPVPETMNWAPDCRFCPPDDDAAVLKSRDMGGLLVLATARVGWKPDCRFCPPDDDANLSIDLGELHSTFEEAFCSALRHSGLPNLANARDCSFSFLDMPGQPDHNLPIHSKENIQAGNTNEAQILLHGMPYEMTEKEYALIDSSIVDAYNEAFSSARFHMRAFETVADLDMTVGWMPDCRFCPPDDDATTVTAGASKLVVARVTPVGWMPDCRFCPPDDDAVVASEKPLSNAKLAFLHKSFEKSFCQKLRNSGSNKFAELADCNFRFVYSTVPVADADIAEK